MSSPPPRGIVAGIDPDANPSETTTTSGNPQRIDSESAKAAQALSTLDSRSTIPASTNNNISAADQKALGEAMSRLEILDGTTATTTTTAAQGQEKEKGKKVDAGAGDGGGDGGKQEKKRKIKIDPADVALLVGELEVSKTKAGEMLRANGGDVGRALSGFVRAMG